jgi:hypothetical protein
MKAVRESLRRALNGIRPLKNKWTAIVDEEELRFYHYQHQILAYNLDERRILYTWWEVPTDKRGIDAALQYLKEYEDTKRTES